MTPPDPRPLELNCDLALPPGFRPEDILAFHQRDKHGLAEKVGLRSLAKGLMWRGSAACLNISFESGRALVKLAIDGGAINRAAGNADLVALEATARRMLGLTQPIEDFEQQFRNHRQLGPVIGRGAGLRVPQAASPFEALAWAVVGQQISVHAAVSVRRKLIQTAGVRQSSGLWCFPAPDQIAAVPESELRQAGLSLTKARTLLRLCELVENRTLLLDEWADEPPVNEIRARLLEVRGIGPWTVDYTLLRGYAWLDGSLHGDVAVRRNLQALLKTPNRPGEDEVRRWLAGFSPWRALVAAHLWSMQVADGY